MTTLFDIKNNMATIGQQIAKIDSELNAKAVDPSATRDEIKALQAEKEDMKTRFEIIKAQHDEMEKEQKNKFAAGVSAVQDPKEREVKAKAQLIRAALRGERPSNDVLAVLGDNTTPPTGGEFVLPKTVSNNVIVEPFEKNPLRNIITVTNITNLEVPRLTFTLDDDDFIADTETAKEMAIVGNTVAFTRRKFKVLAGVSETILNGSDVNLVQYVNNALTSGVAAKEKKVMFATTPVVGEEHMSFYSTQNNITRVAGANNYQAIKNALASLHEDYRANATIVMSYAQYLEIIELLANGSTTLYGVQPSQIFGVPVVFTDAATLPIVGDFSYSHLNYDLNVLYDRDKDVRTGVELFVITAWLDHRIKLASAFRIAEVTPAP